MSQEEAREDSRFDWEGCPKRHASQVQHLLDCGEHTMAPAETIEIGYVCRHGHLQFTGDPDGDACGTKIVGRIYVTPEPEISAATLTEAITESLESHHRKMDEWRSS